MLQVVCVNVGTKFGPEWVNRLRRAVEVNCSLPHDFACLTDDDEGLECRALPLIRDDLQGWWQKVTLFGPHDYVSNRVCYFDLDVVIRKDIDEILRCDKPFLTLRDRGNKRVGMNSSFMLWDHDKYRYVYDQFESPQHPWGDQGYIAETISHIREDMANGEGANDLWPGLVVDYKEDLRFLEPKGDERIIWFHGHPLPSEVDWVQTLWKRQ